MKIFLGTDHAGFEYKERIKKYLQEKEYDFEDCGALTFDKQDDYPDFIAKAARKVAVTVDAKGIILGKSGAGECIVANKVKGIRAVLCFEKENVVLAREHNDVNMLSLGSDFTSFEKAKELIDAFLHTPFSNEERHKRRIEKIKQIENNS